MHSSGGVSVWSWASRLTTVLLVSPVPTVLHAVTVKSTRQTLGEIPTRKISFWAQRSDCTAFSQCIIYVKKGTGILSNGKKLLIWPNSFHIILFNFRKALWVEFSGITLSLQFLWVMFLIITFKIITVIQTSTLPRMESRLIMNLLQESKSKQSQSDCPTYVWNQRLVPPWKQKSKTMS